MHLALLQENLKAALAIVTPAIGKASPVLETVRLVADDAGLQLTATNLDLAITARCAAKVMTYGAWCVPAKLLSEIVAGFPNDRIDLTTEGATLTLRCAGYTASLQCMDADEFPLVPTITPRAELPLAMLKAAAGAVATCAATDTHRPALTGMHLELNGVARAEGADGYRAAQLEQALEGSIDPSLDVIVPAKSILAAARAFRGIEGETVRIGTGQGAGDAFDQPSQLLLDAGDIQVVTRLIDGAYPDIAKVIPTTYVCRVVVETGALRDALAVAGVYAARSSNIVKIQAKTRGELGPGWLTLSANAAEVGEALVTVDALITGDGQIALNAGFLDQALACITTPQVAIELKTAQAPAVLRPVGADGYIHVIMPMTVR